MQGRQTSLWEKDTLSLVALAQCNKVMLEVCRFRKKRRPGKVRPLNRSGRLLSAHDNLLMWPSEDHVFLSKRRARILQRYHINITEPHHVLTYTYIWHMA